jgi:hypothetical protein
MIRPRKPRNFEEIVNDDAMACKGVIPADCWHEPCVPESELRAGIDGGVKF